MKFQNVRLAAIERRLSVVESSITRLTAQGATIMSALSDLQSIVASIQGDETALGTAITSVQTAFANFQAGSVAAADVESAVAALSTAHRRFRGTSAP